MARGETSGDRGASGVRGEPVAAVATLTSTAYAEHGDALRTYLAAYTRDSAAAADLVQETFVRLLTECAAGRMPTHPRAWLFRVARNLAASRARQREVATRRASELLPSGVAPSPEEELLDREAARMLSGRIAHLPEHVRTALILSALGYSGDEIGRRIGRTALATRSLLCRHRSRLRSA